MDGNQEHDAGLSIELKGVGQLRTELAAVGDSEALGRWVARTHVVVGAVFDSGAAVFLEEMARAVAEQLAVGEISLQDARAAMTAYVDALAGRSGAR